MIRHRRKDQSLAMVAVFTTAMPGTIVEIKVKIGDRVTAGDSLVVIEAMKMENEIQAPDGGTVMAIHIDKGDSVSPNETLLEIKQ